MVQDRKIRGHDQDSQLQIVAFGPGHEKAFRDLNLEWIEEYFAVEELQSTAKIGSHHPERE